MANLLRKIDRWLSYDPETVRDLERRDQAMQQLGDIGRDIETVRNNPDQIEQYRQAQDRMNALPQELRAKLPPEAQKLPSQLAGVGDAVKLLGIPTRLERMQYEYGDVPEVKQAMERYEGATRYNDPRAIKGVQQYADSVMDKHPETANYMNMASNLNMNDLAFNSADELSRKQASQSGDGYGKSSVAAALKFTEDNPEMVQSVLETVDMMRKSGKGYDNILLKSIEDNAKTDVRAAQALLTRELFKPATSTQTILQSTPAATEKQYRTSAAGVLGKESAEQSILSGTTITGLKPIKGVRQTEQSINKVKEVKPQMDALQYAINDLIGEYERNGWQPIGPQSAAYESKTRLAQLLSKETALFNLGVLNGPDLSLLEQVIANPGSFKDGLKMARYGKDQIGIRLNNVKDLVDYKAKQFYQNNGFQEDKQSADGGDANLENLRSKYGY